MEIVPLSAGDLWWVFPEPDHAAEVVALLREADVQIRLLAHHLRTRRREVGSGVVFHRLDTGRASLFGYIEVGAVTFEAWLGVPRRGGWDAGSGPPWQVEGEIRVWCDDCGPETIEQVAPRSSDTPLAATRALVDAATWLRERGMVEPPEWWRGHPPRCVHGQSHPMRTNQ